MSRLIDLYAIRSTGVSGFSLNLRMVNVDPFVTVLESVVCRRDPSGSLPSTIGEKTDICLPHICANLTTNELSSSSFLNHTFVGISSYFL